MKRPTMLVEVLLRQAELDLDLSVERDVECLRRRCKHEGFSFLTITLPLLSDALERGLESGTFSCPSNYSSHGRLPRFLGGFFKRVFTKDGKLLPNACPDCIYYIRQISRFFKKLKIGCSTSRERAAIQHFKEVEGELRQMTSQVERKDNILDKISGIIWAQVFPEPDYVDFVCHHGPGVTADRRLSNERYRISKWNHRSEFTFPSDLHCYPNYGIAAEYATQGSRMGSPGWGEGTIEAEGIKYLPLREEEPVRVVFVPKTQTAPRVIAIEPSHMQYMQQSIKDYMYRILETHALTKRSIRFERQDVNQRLAYRSSKDKRLATLDLKDASDRVHLHLVQRIFKTSGLLPYLEDARSLHATLPDGANIVLFKYASMGSALCFPVEACVFYTLIQSAMHALDGRRPSSRSVLAYSKMIDIYGDDIIVPVEYADTVVSYLESYALKVNVNKSFGKGFFRESCGADFYRGVSVKPIYAREVPFDNSRDWTPSTVMSWISTADQFYLNGQWKICQVIRDMVRQVVRRPIPRSRTQGAGVAFLSLLFTTDLRYNRDLQCWQQKRLQYVPIKRKDSIDGNELACLNKWGLHVHSRARNGVGDHQCWSSSQQRGSSFSESSSRSVPRYLFDCGIDSDQSVQRVQDTSSAIWNNSHIVDPVAQTRHRRGSLVQTDIGRILRNSLIRDGEQLDFQASVKRGGFKSKRRWVSLHS